MSRKRRRALAEETVRILEQGSYIAPTGALIELEKRLAASVQGTRGYPAEEDPPRPAAGETSTEIRVTGEGTLEAARRLDADGHTVAALNFASAKNPGGGFLNGAQAQEECLARASGLYACLSHHPMYALHRAQKDPMYTAYVIYSPAVPVFRAPNGELLPEPFEVAMLTAPAVNAGVVLRRDPDRTREVGAEMARRVHKVLGIAAEHGHDALVLGAWGCGVFRNDPDEVAGLFREALEGDFRGVFGRVVFAVRGRGEHDPNLLAFRRAFA